MAGSHAGRRLLVGQPRVTVGRAPDNDVVIDLPYVSRRHAELRFEGDEWLLINHSANGTRLNRRWVYDNPWVIGDPVTLGIGEETVLEVRPQAEGAAAGAATAGAMGAGDETAGESAATTTRPGGGMSRRAKIWSGIGVYFVLMLGLIGFFATLDEGEADEGISAAPELTRTRIVELVGRDIEPRPTDERRARAELAAARELFNRRESEINARYEALEAYRRARAFMPGHELPAIDRRRYRLLEQELSDEVAQRYERAYNLLRSRQYEESLRAFRQLQRVYPAGAGDPLLENIDRHTAAARRAVEGL